MTSNVKTVSVSKNLVCIFPKSSLTELLLCVLTCSLVVDIVYFLG